jgi:hypothetical protein
MGTADAASDTEEASGSASRFGPIGSRLLAVLVAVGLAVLGLVASAVLAVAAVLSNVVSITFFTSSTGTIEAVGLLLLATEGGFLLVGLVYTAWRLGLPIGVPTRREGGWIVGTLVAALALANGLYILASELGLDPARGVFEPAGGNRSRVVPADRRALDRARRTRRGAALSRRDPGPVAAVVRPCGVDPPGERIFRLHSRLQLRG